MMQRPSPILYGVLVWLAAGLPLARPQAVADDAPRIEELRERWESLEPEDRERLAERYRQYLELDEAERAELDESARRLDLAARRLYRSLGRRERARLDTFGVAKRREILREMAAAELRQIGERIRAKLPEAFVQRLEGASVEDRWRFIEQFQRRQRERMGEVLERLGAELGLDELTVERLQDLPDSERGAKFLELVRRRSDMVVDDLGLPPGVTLESWRAIRDLPPDEFLAAILELREKWPAFGSPPGAAELPGLSGEHRALLCDSLRLEPAERLELAALEPAERAAELSRRRRARLERALAAEDVLPPAGLARLDNMEDGPFFHAVRTLLWRGLPPAEEAGAE